MAQPKELNEAELQALKKTLLQIAGNDQKLKVLGANLSGLAYAVADEDSGLDTFVAFACEVLETLDARELYIDSSEEE